MGSIDEVLKKYTIDKNLDPKMIEQMISKSVMHQQEQLEVIERPSIFNKLSNYFGFEVNPLTLFAPSGGIMAMGILGIIIGMNGGILGSDSQTSTLLDPIFYQELQLDDDIDSVFNTEESVYEE